MRRIFRLWYILYQTSMGARIPFATNDAGQKADHPLATGAVLSGVAVGVAFVKTSESAHDAGDFRFAEASHMRAERCFAAILEKTGELTDTDANSVEPQFTEFEEQLIALRTRLTS